MVGSLFKAAAWLKTGPIDRAARGIRLLQTELLAPCQQCERFANTPFPGVRPLGRVNPNDEVTAVGWCQLPKELPSFGIGLYRFRDVIRQVGDYRVSGRSNGLGMSAFFGAVGSMPCYAAPAQSQ